MENRDFITIGVLFLLILLSAFFSSAEMAFSSLNQIKLKHLIQNGNKKAQHTLDLSNNFEKLLTTILIGNNIVNIASASIATVFFLKFWENYGVTISTAVMTTLVLVFGEITPKSLAKKIPEKYALVITPFLRGFIWILTPLNFIFGLWQKLMNKVFKFEKGSAITEEELLTYVSEVQNEGGINENEGELIRSVIDFDDLKVDEILTPRVHVVAVSVTEETKKIIHKFKHTGYSRLPVYEENIDHIVGVINHKDFYNLVVLENQPLDTIIKPPVYVTEYMKVSHLLELLRTNKSHMAIVKDEFGGTIGVVSMEDILEELVGDIWDEHDEVVEQIVKIEQDVYRVKGNADLEDLFDLLGIEDELEFATVNGWVLDVLGRIATIGDEFSYNHLDVKVTAADTKKVLEILITVAQESSEDEL